DLGQTQRDGDLGAHTRSVGDAGVGVEPGRYIECEHLQAGRVDRLDPGGKRSFWCAREPGAEDGVHHESPALELKLVRNVDADFPQRLELPARRPLESLRVDAADPRQLPPAQQVPRRGQAVARVVAHPAYDHRTL